VHRHQHLNAHPNRNCHTDRHTDRYTDQLPLQRYGCAARVVGQHSRHFSK